MEQPIRTEAGVTATFGRRRVVPRACVVDGKPHIRSFLCEALEDIGFVTGECDGPDGLQAALCAQQPDLVVLGLSAGGIAASAVVEALGALEFDGQVLVFGPPTSLMVTAILGIGAENGLAMLPLLPTPFNNRNLRERVSRLLPHDAPPPPPVDAGEAIRAKWLELWYQPKIAVRSFALGGAEAVVHLRHPTWGIFPPAAFNADPDDPHFGTLAEFVITRVVADWHYFVSRYGNVEISVNLPVSFFEHPGAIDALALWMPDHPAFAGLIVEITGSDLIRNSRRMLQAAHELQLHNIGVAIGELGTEWPLLMQLDEFPFVEIKVERGIIAGCAEDRLKQSTCKRIIELADQFGARTVANGVKTRADFLATREMGFDLVQGNFFAKPMAAAKFARRILGKPIAMPH